MCCEAVAFCVFLGLRVDFICLCHQKIQRSSVSFLICQYKCLVLRLIFGKMGFNLLKILKLLFSFM